MPEPDVNPSAVAETTVETAADRTLTSTDSPDRRKGSYVWPIVVLMLGALFGGILVPALMLWILQFTHFPAFGNSNFLHSLTTVAQVVMVLIGVAAAIWAYLCRLRNRRGEQLSMWRTHTWPGIFGAISATGLVTTSLAFPLAATKLYLHGISADQAFRTEYLTRLTDSIGLHDMAYLGLPPAYPAGWFWWGGRLANLISIPGWAAFKPWAILSIAITAALVAAFWTLLLRPDIGIIVGLVNAAIITAYGSPEPYAAITAMAVPVILALGWHAVNPHPNSPIKGRLATAAATLLLGFSATTYTLFTAIPAVALIIMAIIATVRYKHISLQPWQPLVRLLIIGVGSSLLALTVWGPYIINGMGKPKSSGGSALHYLPENGATVLLPMFKTDAVGLLCLIGVIWLVIHIRRSRTAQALTIGILTMYLWTLASMSSVILGFTLLGFRVGLLLTLTMALAGMLGIFDATRWLVGVSVRNIIVSAEPRPDAPEPNSPLVKRGKNFTLLAGPRSPISSLDPTVTSMPTKEENVLKARRTAHTVQAIVIVICTLVSIGFVQDIPDSLADEIQLAYTDTDGYGARADRFPAGIPSYYPQVNDLILEGARQRSGTASTPSDIILLTTEEGLLAYYPYWAFQAISPHYANPLGLYEKRNALIERWALSTSPDELLKQLKASPFPAPNAFVFRRDGDNLSLTMSGDVYPNQPNVHNYTLSFASALFQDHCFLVHDAGPLTVVTVLCPLSKDR